MDIFQIIGICGALIYLGAYASLQLGLLRGNSIPYASINISAASCILISMFSEFNMGSAIIQISFITLSSLSILRFLIAKIPPSVTMDEKNLADKLLPGVPLRRAMSVLRIGDWHIADTAILTVENEPLEAIYYLACGSASVSRKGNKIGTVRENELIGDMGVLQNVPASASVQLAQPSRYYAIDADTFRAALNGKEDIRMSFQGSALSAMSARLRRANRLETVIVI
jgi:hypothetical protein